MIQARKQSTSTYPILFFMADSADHVTGKTSLTPTVTISKNGGAFGAASGAVSEIANGWYALAGNATDRNTLGALAIHAAASGADPADVVVQIVSYDPYGITADVWTNATRSLTDKADFALSSANMATIVDEVWDEPLTGATHNVATSSGKRIRTMDSNVILSDVLPSQAGVATNAIKFDGGASSVNGAYDPAMIVILDGLAAGQCRLIYQYNGSTKTAYVDRDWKVQPSTGETFAIIADPGREHVNEGLAQAGGTNTITLNANASADDDAYLGQIIFLRGGTGADQASSVTAYNGTTKVATVNKDWAVQPDNTTTYVMLPSGLLYLAGLVNDVWSAGTRTLTQAAVSPTNSITAGNLIGLRGDTFSQSLTSLGSLANYSALYFTAKTDYLQADSEAILQIVKKPGGSDGLLYLNGATTTTSWGSITIDDANAGDITISLNASATKELVPMLYHYDVQIVRSVGTPVSTIAVGRLSINEDVTRSIA